MAIFKCKMCGGTVEFTPGATVGECDSCGTKQTLPRLDDERRVNLYDRANHFRRANEYDKAMGIYETILAEDKTDAEAYWSLVLCRYGVEYVEDPASHKRVPTVNRAQYTSVLADEDYKSALQYADTLQKSIYEAEAKAIDDIQKGILEISQKEEPFDVFICYKETDANGRRTPDSVLATELYHELTKAGYKVFFSRITLEDKLGTAYEPYIFAALHSAKVMVVLGTKAEHFNAVWVKNEWSRYLALIQSGEKKTLIPAYKDMDPYDLPEAFSHLQAQDMAKLGFMQDLLHGIKKIIGSDEKPQKETVVVQSAPSNANVTALIERGFMALEDGEWDRADGFFEEALNQDAKNALCYLGKLMAELKIRKREDLKNAAEPFDDRNNCKKASRFDAAIAKELADANAYIRERNETARKEKIYQDALVECMKGSENGYRKASELFSSITGYKDADKRAKDCNEKAKEKAEADHKNEIYTKAVDTKTFATTVVQFEEAARLFDSVADYRDSRAKADECRQIIEEKKKAAAEHAEAARVKKNKLKKLLKKVAIIGTPIVAAVIVFLIVLNSVIIPKQKHNKAMELLKAEEYDAAYALLEELGDSKTIQASKYDLAVALIDAGERDRAIEELEALDDYKEASEKLSELHYNMAVEAETAGNIRAAALEYGKAGAFKDAHKRSMELHQEIQRTMNGLISSGGFFTVALRTDGTVVSAGVLLGGNEDVSDWKDIVAVSVGESHAVGLRNNGTVIATKFDDEDSIYNNGQCDVDNWTDIIAVSAGYDHTVGLRADGTVVSTKIKKAIDNDGESNVGEWKDIIAVAAGRYHTVGLHADGTVVAVGANRSGQCNVVEDWTNIVAVTAWSNSIIGLKADGTIITTDDSDFSDWKNIVAISEKWDCTVGLHDDGTIIGEYYGNPDLFMKFDGVNGWSDIVAVSAGDDFVVGLRSNGTVVAAGDGNTMGECDVDGWKNIRLPDANNERRDIE